LELGERDREEKIEHGGYMREFIVHLPTGYERLDRMPLLIVLHGGGSTARGMIRLTRGRFSELADRHNFLVVYPQGLGKSWNDDRQDPISFAHKHNIDDIGFLAGIIRTMRARYKADSGRVFVTGISNGGFMSIRVSRELTDQVKGTAPVCASIPLGAQQAHLDAPPANVLLINGTEDPLVPYLGGEVKVLGSQRGRIIPTGETIRIFISRNRCSEIPEITELDDVEPEDGTKVIRYGYKNNDTGHWVILMEVVGGGHTWPGGWPYLNQRLIGRTSRDFNACDAIWSFFYSLP
jgi:polyhydroxybutyrate depolymerase